MTDTVLTNAEVRAALQGSIQKWEKIVAKTGHDDGRFNCPLCHLFHTGSSPACSGCPVKEYTGTLFCHRTPFDAWIDYSSAACQTDGYAVSDKDVELAQAEVDFLKMLDRHYFRDM